MKFFEYLAAGLPVVAVDAGALADYGHVCDLVASKPEFVSAVDRVLRGQRPDVAECLRVARRHTWEWRTREMLTILEETWNNHHAPTIPPLCEPRRSKAG